MHREKRATPPGDPRAPRPRAAPGTSTAIPGWSQAALGRILIAEGGATMESMTRSHSSSTTPAEVADERRWQAVLSRDASHDGRFVYAVHTTGVYCRPSCPSRRPLRQRVSFFDTGAAAREAGFRACRRCDPDGAGPRAEQAGLIAAACRYLESHAGETVTLARLARHVGYAPHHLLRVFRARVGMTPREYAAALRAGRLKAGLKAGLGVAGATYDAGYGSSSRVYERAGERLGMTPGRYARGGAGERIRYGVARGALGAMLVAASERGVCAVRFGAGVRALERELAVEFPRAERVRDDAALAPWLAELEAYVAGRIRELALPLDIAATAFQARVWRALRAIPAGETRTYGEVARAIGAPSATRAVASAIAANPLAVVLPCHRVVPATGGVGGYRWGATRKRRLIETERNAGGR
jgi:AraC family transcriptional regulator of adaptative response/methylated-DNA-[protein]-cysteine methyltransferase